MRSCPNPDCAGGWVEPHPGAPGVVRCPQCDPAAPQPAAPVAVGAPVLPLTAPSSHPGHHGGDTEQAAAARAWPRSGTQRDRVLQAIIDAGREGCTDQELEDRLYLARPSPGNRRGELVAAGWVRDSGRRRDTRSGNPAIVWVLAERAVAHLAEERAR